MIPQAAVINYLENCICHTDCYKAGSYVNYQFSKI